METRLVGSLPSRAGVGGNPTTFLAGWPTAELYTRNGPTEILAQPRIEMQSRYTFPSRGWSAHEVHHVVTKDVLLLLTYLYMLEVWKGDQG